VHPVLQHNLVAFQPLSGPRRTNHLRGESAFESQFILLTKRPTLLIGPLECSSHMFSPLRITLLYTESGRTTREKIGEPRRAQRQLGQLPSRLPAFPPCPPMWPPPFACGPRRHLFFSLRAAQQSRDLKHAPSCLGNTTRGSRRAAFLPYISTGRVWVRRDPHACRPCTVGHPSAMSATVWMGFTVAMMATAGHARARTTQTAVGQLRRSGRKGSDLQSQIRKGGGLYKSHGMAPRHGGESVLSVGFGLASVWEAFCFWLSRSGAVEHAGLAT